jgi:ComF family protein
MNFLDILFPKHCVGCGRLGAYVCPACKKQIVLVATNECVCPVCDRRAFGGVTHPRCRSRYSLDGLTSFFYYTTVMREIIRSIKYRFVSDMVSPLVDLIPSPLFGLLPMSKTESSVIIPIPLHPSRLRHRGFNQAEKIGTILSSQLHIPMRIDMLMRTRKTDPQVSMKDRGNRLKNMEGVFAVRPEIKKELYNTGIFLLDDVFTTGATMRAAAKTLKQQGAKFVWGITIAR